MSAVMMTAKRSLKKLNELLPPQLTSVQSAAARQNG